MEFIEIVTGSFFSFLRIEELSGRFTFIPAVRSGAVTINIIKSTSITSTKGVTLMSDIDFLVLYFFAKLYLNISLEIIKIISSEKTSSLFEIFSSMLLNLLKNNTDGIAATKPKAVAKSASAIPGATTAKLVF